MAEEETTSGAPAAGGIAAENSGPHKDPEDPEVGDDGVQEARGKWANKTEFLLSMAGEIIGLGNVWRFPYLCYKNGGGVFFIPYFVFLFCCGIPVFFLETAMGQYTSQGGVTAWRKICPMFEGIGIASQVIVMYLNIYYIVILAWALFYLYNSFKYPLPWSTCDNYWNTEMCHNRLSVYANPHMFNTDSSWSFLSNNTTPSYYSDDYGDINGTTMFGIKSPEEEFWMLRVLRMSDDMSVGHIHWDLAFCLAAAWVICYFCIWKGIKSTGKVVYFTATFPYLMLFILFIRGVTLPGAATGLKYYLMPDLSKIADPAIWRDAGTQVFFSYAVCQGVLTALGSYNKYNNNCYRDCVALCCLNSATSIFAGFAVFSALGYMAHELGVDVADVASSGHGLAFISYPRVLSMLPGANVWAVLFFLMLFLLGLDSQFVCVESFATAVTDMFPAQLRGRRELLVLAIAVSCFLLGLPLVSQGGALIFTMMDIYGPSGTSLLFIACFETVVIAWVYGADRFYDNIEDMIGYRPFPVLKYCWLFVTPLICGVTMMYDLAVQQPLMVYDYVPSVATTSLCSILIIVPLMCIPVYIFVALVRNPNGMTTPSSDLRQAWPHRPILTLCNVNVYKGREKSHRSDAEMDEKMMVEATGV